MPDHSIRDAVFVVEATHAEKFCFWKLNDMEPRVKWEHVSMGYGHQVGALKVGRKVHPVVVAVSFAILDGSLVAFYEPTSRVVDYDMVEAWVKAESPAYASGKKCNADNFHHCLGAVVENKKIDPPAVQG